MTNILTNAEAYFEKVATAVEDSVKPVFSSILTNFIETDIGKLAVDAVNYAETLSDESDEGKRDAAKTQLLNDAESAGHDLSTAATSFLNFLIETALQATLAGAITAAV